MKGRSPTRSSPGIEPRHFLRALFDEGVAAVSAEKCMPPALDQGHAAGRTVIIAVGKAAAAMASVAASRITGPVSGLVVTPRGHAGAPHMLPDTIELIEAGHPVPDTESLAAATRALALVQGLGAKDRVLALISGGGSALLAMPVPGVSLADKQAVTRSLLRSGATIAEINSVRKHLSLIKGGRLAVAAAPAHVTTLVFSDVPGDDPDLVASGPTIADHGSLAMARALVEHYRIDVPANVMAALHDSENETPSANAAGLADGDVRIIAQASQALAAARQLAEAQGYAVTDLGDRLQAEARHMGADHAELARRLAEDGVARVILSGGETTVHVINPEGRGGRNLEYLLGLALALDGAPRIHAIACDTDGLDGTEDNAGAVITPDTLERARALGLDAQEVLRSNCAYDFFAALGDLVVTGPTRTNVNDLRAILIEPAGAPFNARLRSRR